MTSAVRDQYRMYSPSGQANTNTKTQRRDVGHSSPVACPRFTKEQNEGTKRGQMYYHNYEDQNKSPQNVPLWQVDYFEPKTIKAQKSQEEFLTSCLIA